MTQAMAAVLVGALLASAPASAGAAVTIDDVAHCATVYFRAADRFVAEPSRKQRSVLITSHQKLAEEGNKVLGAQDFQALANSYAASVGSYDVATLSNKVKSCDKVIHRLGLR